MKKTLLLLILFYISAPTYSQSRSVERTKIFGTGTGILVDGFYRVQMDSISDTDTYYVQLTAVDSFIELYISEKSNNSFVVKSKSLSNGKFDYIIFVTRKKVKESNIQKNKKVD